MMNVLRWLGSWVLGILGLVAISAVCSIVALGVVGFWVGTKGTGPALLVALLLVALVAGCFWIIDELKSPRRSEERRGRW